jgi:cytochrome b561
MSATETTHETDSDETAPVPGPKRLQPHQIAVVIGIAIAAIVVVSGIAATTLQWHDESEVQREVFGGIPSGLKLAFYVVIPIMFIIGAVMFSNRMKNWERGGPDRRNITPRNAKKRMEKLRAGLYMQTLMRDPAAGIMHSMIYFGFLVLLAVTTILEINHQLPEAAKFLNGKVYQGFAFVGDLGGIVFLVGVLWAIVRRYI